MAVDNGDDDIDLYEEDEPDELEEYHKAQKQIEQRAAVEEEEALIRERFGGNKKLSEDGEQETGDDPERATDMRQSIEIYSAQFVDKLGYMPDGGYSSADYRISTSCKSNLRNLLRISHNEVYPFPIRSYLSKAKIIQRDLVHIAVQSAAASDSEEDKQDLFGFALRLMLYLTTPLDDRLLKEMAERNANEVEALRLEMHAIFAQMKEELSNENFYSALRTKLEILIRKPKNDWEENEDMDFSRLLKFITNILSMPSSIRNTSGNVVVSSLSAHDRIVMAMHKSRLDALIMYLAASKDFHEAAMDALEIFYYMLVPYDPESIGQCVKPGSEVPFLPSSANSSHAVFKTQPPAADQVFASVLHEQKLAHNAVEKRASGMSRYRGCVEVRNLKAFDEERNVLTNRPIADILANNVDATFMTAAGHKPMRRRLKEAQLPSAITVTIVLDPRICWTVKLVCEQILKTSYNKLIRRANDLLTAAILADERHAMFIWAVHYFVKYNVACASVIVLSSSASSQRQQSVSAAAGANGSGATEASVVDLTGSASNAADVGGKTIPAVANNEDCTGDPADTSGNTNKQRIRIAESTSLPSGSKFRVELVSQALDKHIFQQIQTYITACYERIKSTDRLKSDVWLQRIHVAIKAFRDMLYALLALQNTHDDKLISAAKALENHIFYVPEYRDLCLAMLQAIEPHRLPLSILQDVIETNHIFLRLLEGYIWAERGHFVAIDQKRRRKANKNAAKKRKIDATTDNSNGDAENVDGLDDADKQFAASTDRAVAAFIDGADDSDDDSDADGELNEAEFDFVQFLRKFAHSSSLKPYFVVLAKYRENTLLVNHACVKMFHRMVFEVKVPAVLYKATLFLTFQKILNDPFLDAQTTSEKAKSGTSDKNRKKVNEGESAAQLKEMVRVVLRSFFADFKPKKVLALMMPLDIGQAERLDGVLALPRG